MKNILLILAGLLVLTSISFSADPFLMDFESSEGYSTTYDAGGTQTAGDINFQPVTNSKFWSTLRRWPAEGLNDYSEVLITASDAYSGTQCVYIGAEQNSAYMDSLYHYERSDGTTTNWYWALGGAFASDPPKYIHIMYKPTGTWDENNFQGIWLNKYFGGVVFWMKNGEIGLYGSPSWYPFGTGDHQMQRLGDGSFTIGDWHQIIINPYIGDDTDDPGDNPDVYLRVWAVNVETGEWISIDQDTNLYSGAPTDGHDPYTRFNRNSESNDLIIGNISHVSWFETADADDDPNSYKGGSGYYDAFFFQENDPNFAIDVPLTTCEDVKDAGYSLAGDINGDCYVNTTDLAAIIERWLYCISPLDPICDEPWLNF